MMTSTCLAATDRTVCCSASYLLAQMKDVSKLESSLSRGGLLLADYTGVLATASYAVKVSELLRSADVPTTLPAIARAHKSIDAELYTVSNTIAGTIDFQASNLTKRRSLSGPRAPSSDG